MLGSISGMEQAVAGLEEVTSFLQAFLPVQYSVEQDPMLQHPVNLHGDDDGKGKDGGGGDEGQDAFKVVDAISQAQADLDDLRNQANDAAAQAVCDAAARAVAVVTGAVAEDTPSPAAAIQKFAARIQEAEAKLEAAKLGRKNESEQVFPPLPPHAPVRLAAAEAPTSTSTSTSASSSSVLAVGVTDESQADTTGVPLPAALRSAEQVAALPVPPEGSRLPAAFAIGAARHSGYRMQRSKFEGWFPPAQGGPRGRARSTDAAAQRARRRSRSTPGAAEVEVLDDKGDQVMGGDGPPL